MSSTKISRRGFIVKSAMVAGFAGSTGILNAKEKNAGKEGAQKAEWKNASGPMSQEGGVPKRKLGRTGRMITVIGFGGGSRFADWVPDDTWESPRMLIDYAIRLGITYFDAARSYGRGRTEERYGKYLTPSYRDRIFLNSKTGQRTYDGVMKDIETSLTTMKTDYLDNYCMHAIDYVEDVDTLLGASGGYRAFQKLKDEGTVKAIGFSYHKWNEASQKAFREMDIDTVLCPLNAARASGSEDNMIPLAQERNIGVIAIKATGQNALIGNVTGAELVHYTLSMPVVAASVGMDGFATLESCVEVSKRPVLANEQMQDVERRLAFDPKKVKLPYFTG